MTARRQFFAEKLRATGTELDYLEQVDPTGKRWSWILRGSREGWFTGVEVCKIQEALKIFNRLSQSPRFREANYHPDINKYTWDALTATLEVNELKSNKQKAQEFEGCELMYSSDEVAVYKVLTPRGAALAGQGSRWCTAANLDTATGYLNDGYLYIAHVFGVPYAQIHPKREEWNLASNIVTRQNIFDTRVWTDGVGYDIFMRAAKKCSDNELLRGLKKRPLVSISVEGDNRITAILSPFNRMPIKAERRLIRDKQIPVGYFRRFRKQRDPELESYLAIHGTPDACLDYIESVSNDAGEIFLKKIFANDRTYARYIDRCLASNFDFTNKLNLFREWMNQNPSQPNPSALRLLNCVGDESARNYLKRFKLTSPTYHRQLISDAENFEPLYRYERDILGEVDPRTTKRILQAISNPHIQERYSFFAGRFWIENPEYRDQIPVSSRDVLESIMEHIPQVFPDVERALIASSIQDFDYSQFRNYALKIAEPGISDDLIVHMSCRHGGHSIGWRTVEEYLKRYPNSLAKRQFLIKMLGRASVCGYSDLLRFIICQMNSREIVAGVSTASQWSEIVSCQRGNKVALAALRLMRENRFTTYNWSSLNRWRVSPYVRKLFPASFSPVESTASQLVFIALDSVIYGFNPTNHPDLLRCWQNGRDLDQALCYASRCRESADLCLSCSSDSQIEWCGWGLYSHEDRDLWQPLFF